MIRFVVPILAVALLIGCSGQGEKGANKGSDVPVPVKKDTPPAKKVTEAK